MILKTDVNRIRLKDVIGGGYGTYWRFKGRYRVCKGSRASKKSKTTALYYIVKMMEMPLANLLVVRKSYNTIEQSVYKEFKWAVNRLGVEEFWTFSKYPLEATYNPTGQKIYFRGLDDPLKLTSITVEVGHLCWCWIEEAYEILKEPDFDMLDESIRGGLPEGYFKQITLTLNPWNERHWINKRFFQGKEDPDVLAITTNYQINEWLDNADLKVFERMKKHNPRRYQVAGLGNWGISEGVIYENWREDFFALSDMDNFESVTALDFGYTNDPSAFFVGFLDLKGKRLYVWDEIYQKGLSNKKIFDEVNKKGYGKKSVTADSAEPKSIDELKGLGMRIKGAKKGPDSVRTGIQWVQDLEIIVHPRCVNFLTEISNYSWDKDKFGNLLNVPIDDFNHLMDAMRYGLESHITGSKWLY